jgi:hypothetical protein
MNQISSQLTSIDHAATASGIHCGRAEAQIPEPLDNIGFFGYSLPQFAKVLPSGK